MDVTLHVYDLSMGMARTMSPALLGRTIDLIPHTGIVLQGIEYFFGGGIQQMPTQQVPLTMGLQPVERLRLGTTTKTIAEFRAFLHSIRDRFTMATYDL